MPTWEGSELFWRDYDRLSAAQRAAFARAVQAFFDDLVARRFRKSLRVHKVRRTPLWSLTWAPDGRATFEFGPPQRDGHPHIIWWRIGGHEIYR